MPEKNIRLKKSFITLDYHGALTLLLLALPPAPIKSLILSAMAAVKKFFFMDISCMAYTHCVGGSSEPRLETGHVSWQAGTGNRETYIAFSIQCVRLGLGHILNISSPSLALHSPSVALHSRGLKPGPYNIITPESHLHGLGDGGPCPRLGTLAINM